MRVEDNSRPEWEEQNIQGGQYDEQYLQQLSQDKRIIFGDQYLEESKGVSSPLRRENGSKDSTQSKQDPNAMMKTSKVNGLTK